MKSAEALDAKLKALGERMGLSAIRPDGFSTEQFGEAHNISTPTARRRLIDAEKEGIVARCKVESPKDSRIIDGWYEVEGDGKPKS